MTAHNHPVSPEGASLPGVSSIRRASQATGIDFGMLMVRAKEESGFRVDAKEASGTSAAGLFRFIEATWLRLVQRFGEKYGVGDLGRRIASDSSGQPTVTDEALRERILGLRSDPVLSAALATEYARANKAELARALGRAPENAELYLAHFLGASGAAVLLKAVAQNGEAVGAALLPQAAGANRGVFFDDAGRARTVREIYHSFAERIDREARRFASPNADATQADVPGFIPRLGFHGQQLSRPTLAMLNAFALSALQLLARPRRANLASRGPRPA